MASAWHTPDEPELCTEPVWVECKGCGIRMQADPIDLAYENEDDAEYLCLACTRDKRGKREVA